MNLRTILLLCCLAGFGLLPSRAQATTTCSASTPGIVVAGYDGTAQATANTTVTVSCDSDASSLFGGTAYITLCLYIGNSPRTLQNGTSSLSYDLYTAGNSVWQGPTASPPAQQSFTFSYPVGGFLTGGGGSGQVTIPVSARIPAPQSGLSSGTYSQALTATSGEFRSYEPTGLGGGTSQPASCKTGGNGGSTTSLAFPFTVSANVAPRCVIKTATDLAFGSVPGFITSNVDQTSLVTLNCTNGSAWNVGLGNGTNASGSTRRLADGSGNYVTYELYRDSGRSLRWGTTINADTLAGSGNGNDQSVTVYGRVPAQTAVPGNYGDTVTVTVTY